MEMRQNKDALVEKGVECEVEKRDEYTLAWLDLHGQKRAAIWKCGDDVGILTETEPGRGAMHKWGKAGPTTLRGTIDKSGRCWEFRPDNSTEPPIVFNEEGPVSLWDPQ
jgi:hypothetical protein